MKSAHIGVDVSKEKLDIYVPAKEEGLRPKTAEVDNSHPDHAEEVENDNGSINKIHLDAYAIKNPSVVRLLILFVRNINIFPPAL